MRRGQKRANHLHDEFGLEIPFCGGWGKPERMPYGCLEKEGDFRDDEAGYRGWTGVHGLTGCEVWEICRDGIDSANSKTIEKGMVLNSN